MTVTDQVVAAAEALNPGEAIFLPFECVVARSHAGTLRFGCGLLEPRWVRADALEELRGTLGHMLNPRETGHFAAQYRRRLVDGYTLRSVPVVDVGRKSFRVDRAVMAAAA